MTEDNKSETLNLGGSIRMDSPLPQLGTIELVSARRKEELLEADLPEMLDISEE